MHQRLPLPMGPLRAARADGIQGSLPGRATTPDRDALMASLDSPRRSSAAAGILAVHFVQFFAS
jgi:hypothetical protein